MAFPSQSSSSFQTAFEDDVFSTSHWAMDVAWCGNTTSDRYDHNPSIPVDRSSDEPDCSSDDEDDLDPHGFYSSYWCGIHLEASRHLSCRFYSQCHQHFISSDFDQIYIPAGSITECGHDDTHSADELSPHMCSDELSSTPVDRSGIPERVCECSGDVYSADDAATPVEPTHTTSTRVGAYYDGLGSDENAEDDFEDGSSDDDEEVPVFKIPISKKRPAISQLDPSTPELCSSPSPTASPSTRVLSDSPAQCFRARHIQGTAEEPLEPVEKNDPWACSYGPPVQTNGRKSDLKRI